MRMIQFLATLASLSSTALPASAHAEAFPTQTAFVVSAVPDAELASIRGGYSPFRTNGGIYTVIDSQSRSDFRTMGNVGRISMDIWWGSIGSELIATSVRASTP